MNNNNYFNDIQKQDELKKSTKAPGWVWAVCIIGLVLSIIWGYTIGKNTILTFYEMATIPDNDPTTSRLEVLDFSECLLVFPEDEYKGIYNLIDYPAFAMYYDSNRTADEFGLYPNSFNGSTYIESSFRNMSYYDVFCVFDAGKDYKGNVNYVFESELKKGNMEVKVFTVSKNYTTEATSDGYNVIKSEYITEIAHFDTTKDESGSFDGSQLTANGDVYYVFVVGAESAYGSYELRVSAEG